MPATTVTIPTRTDAATRHRRRYVLGEISAIVALCFAGSWLLSEPFRRLEIFVATAFMHAVGVTEVSDILDMRFTIVTDAGAVVVAAMTASCSSLWSILALIGLAATVLRGRGPHTVLGCVVACSAVFAANMARVVISLFAGVQWGQGALVAFHDWVGTIFNVVYTLLGFLLLVYLTLPTRERAEQDASGKHTASRPGAWARPGLGYREGVDDTASVASVKRRRLVTFWYRRVLPQRLAARKARKREARRIDYRVGHLAADERAATIVRLGDDGLATHAATLLAVASYDTDKHVLDTLADVIAARVWEPVVNDDVAKLRLWAHAWTMRCAPVGPVVAGHRVLVTGAGGPAGVAVIRSLVANGHWVLGVDADASAVGGRLAHAYEQVPYASEPTFARQLTDLARSHQCDAVLCTVAEEYDAVETAGPALAGVGCKIWLPPKTARDICNDKAAFAKCLSRANVRHPLTSTDMLTMTAATTGPWIVKPRRGRGSRDVTVCATPAELYNAFGAGDDLIAQTLSPGNEFTADAFVDRTATLTVCVPRWRTETKAGISVKGTTFHSTAVHEAVKATVQAVGYQGPICVQGFVGDDGRVTIIEANPRFSGGLPLTIAAGADTVEMTLSSTLDATFVPAPAIWEAGVTMLRHHTEIFERASS